MRPFAFDIETTGLDPLKDKVTCICICGKDFEHCWLPMLEGRPESFFEFMDRAPFIVAFNGVSFDINFLQKQYDLPDERVGSWVLKLRDVCEASHLAFDRRFSLNKFLSCNHYQTKISTGAEAVLMAQEGRWDEIREYCMSDATLTWLSMEAGHFALPIGINLDLVNWVIS